MKKTIILSTLALALTGCTLADNKGMHNFDQTYLHRDLDQEQITVFNNPSNIRDFLIDNVRIVPSPKLELQNYDSSLAKIAEVPSYLPTEGQITSLRGIRWGKMHQGLDIWNQKGSPIYSAATGVVTFSGGDRSRSYGTHVIIKHGTAYVTLYGHMDTALVKAGDTVRRGQQIGTMGNSGDVSGPTGVHLHFEIRDGNLLNPKFYDPRDFVPELKNAYMNKKIVRGVEGNNAVAANR